MTFYSAIKLAEKIVEFVKSKDSKFFKEHPYGHFDIIYSANELNVFELDDYRVYKLVICGFSRDEVFQLLKNFQKDILKKTACE